MRPAKALKLIQPVLSKPTFTASEAQAYGISRSSLQHYVKTGHLEKVRRGIYRAVDAPMPQDTQWADLVEAALSIPGSTICLVSALAIYELTDEIPRKHWLAVSHETTIKARPPIKIVRYRNVELGRTEMELGGIRVSIYDRERTILDAFRQLSRETAIKALKAGLAKGGPDRLNLVRLQAYAKKLRVPIGPYLLTVTT